MKTEPMVERLSENMIYPLSVRAENGDVIHLTWGQAARLVGELQAELQDREVVAQEQRELEARAAQMIAVTAMVHL